MPDAVAGAASTEILVVLVRAPRDTWIGYVEPADLMPGGPPKIGVRGPLILVGDGWQQVEVPLSQDEIEALRFRGGLPKPPRPGGPTKLVWAPQSTQMLALSPLGDVPASVVDRAGLEWYPATEEHAAQYARAVKQMAEFFERRKKPPSALTESATEADVKAVAAIVDGARSGAA